MQSKKIFAAAFSLLLSFSLFSQQQSGQNKTKQPYSLSEHLVYGGNLGLTFGNLTDIGIAPMVGYKVTDKFIPGISVSYDYLQIRYSGYPTQTAQTYGGSIFANYFVLENIFAHAEYEVLNGEWDPYYFPGHRYNLSSVLLGGGYREKFGSLSSYVLVLYDVTQGSDSPYSSPLVIRVGFAEGF